MFHQRNACRNFRTFEPNGSLIQLDRANRAAQKGPPGIGVISGAGVVLAVEKCITHNMQDYYCVENIMEIDEHIACAATGMHPDAYSIVEYARFQAQDHRSSYGLPMSVENTAQAISDMALKFDEDSCTVVKTPSRPLGASCFIAGLDENGPSLYSTYPDGSFWGSRAIMFGSWKQNTIKEFDFKEEPDIITATVAALAILKFGMSKELTPYNIDVVTVAPTFHRYTPTQLIENEIVRLAEEEAGQIARRFIDPSMPQRGYGYTKLRDMNATD